MTDEDAPAATFGSGLRIPNPNSDVGVKCERHILCVKCGAAPTRIAGSKFRIF